jgi:CBS domain containing-hemolysin-like protein
MRVIQLALYPLVVTLNGVGNGMLRWSASGGRAGASTTARPRTRSRTSCARARPGGLLRKEAGDMVQELLEFGERTAEQVMVPRVRVVGLPLRDGAPARCARLLERTPHTRYPSMKGRSTTSWGCCT